MCNCRNRLYLEDKLPLCFRYFSHLNIDLNGLHSRGVWISEVLLCIRVDLWATLMKNKREDTAKPVGYTFPFAPVQFH